MSKLSRKLIKDLSTEWAGLETAIDDAINGDFTTGFALCVEKSGDLIRWHKDVSDKGQHGLNLMCVGPNTEYKASIIITPNKKTNHELRRRSPK